MIYYKTINVNNMTDSNQRQPLALKVQVLCDRHIDYMAALNMSVRNQP